MANPGFNIPTSPAESGQAQMRRDDNQSSNIQNQGQPTNFLQETGTQVKNMAQGASEVGMEAAQGAVNIAKGAAQGAANMVQGAADAVKNTFGINNNNNNLTKNNTKTAYDNPSPTTTHPSNI